MSTALVEPDIDVTDMTEFEFGIPCGWDMHPKYGTGDAVWVLYLVPVLPCGCPTVSPVLTCDGCLAGGRKMGFAHGSTHYTFGQVVARVDPLRCPPSGG